MAEWLLLAFYVQIPVVIGGVVHMLAVSRDWCPSLKIPVQTRLFGANKTWRGFVLMPLFTTLGAAALWPLEQWLGMQAVYGAWLLPAGFCAGLAYVLAELPNSFIKRRLGIAPGATPARRRALFIALDQLDSGLGVAVAYAFLPGLPLPVCLLYALTFPLTALTVKRLLFMARLKQSAV